VEWLVEQLSTQFTYGQKIQFERLFEMAKERDKEQAKEMEKEQIAKAFDRGRFWNMSWDGNSYYEEIIIKGNNE
jgi:hypothetical protein